MARKKSTKRKSKRNSWYEKKPAKRHKTAAKKGWTGRKKKYSPTRYWKPETYKRKGVKPQRKKKAKTKANPIGAYGRGLSLSGMWNYTVDTFTINNVVGGVLGAVATMAVPKIVKMNDGSWKELGVSVATVGVGGYLITKYVDRQVGYAYSLTGAAVVGLKGIRLALSHSHSKYAKTASHYLSGTQEDVVSDAMDGFMGLADFGIGADDEYELFGVGEDYEDEEDLDELFGDVSGGLMPTFTGA